MSDRIATALTLGGLAATLAGFASGREGLLLAGGAAALVGAWGLAYVGLRSPGGGAR
jgi:hypothetical protein